jgi:hypothetical protein
MMLAATMTRIDVGDLWSVQDSSPDVDLLMRAWAAVEVGRRVLPAIIAPDRAVFCDGRSEALGTRAMSRSCQKNVTTGGDPFRLKGLIFE